MPDTSSATSGSVQDKPYPSAAIGWYATVLLALLYWLSILDRTIISLLVHPIKADIGISDVQFGMLHGMAFAVTFSLFGLAAGAFADRMNRRRVVFLSVLIWSVATAACGTAKSFGMLLLFQS
jgi:predicted MFS family arabinose efflux permease